MVGGKAIGRKWSLSAIAVVFACLTANLLCAAVGATSLADESIAWIENRITLLDATRRGYVNMDLTATGSVGVAVEMSIESTLDIALSVTVEPGLVLDCDVPGVQRLVVRSPVEFNVGTHSEASRFIVLRPEEILRVELEAYCLDARDRLPDPGTAYRIVGMASPPVEDVLRTSIQQDQHAGICALQTAVWIAQSNMTRAEYELRLGARCLETDVARALALCRQAGVTPDASWGSQTVPTDPEPQQVADLGPESDPEPVPVPEADVDQDSGDLAEEERSSSFAEWLLLGALIGGLAVAVALLEGF